VITEQEIQKRLDTHFVNYEYHLKNSFIFNWESDYFCMSKSGYFVEIEIKCSRSDFFKDFEKAKHKIFKDLVNKKAISVFLRDPSYWNQEGDVIVKNFEQVEVSCRHYRPPRPYELDEKKSREIKNGSELLVEINPQRYRSRGGSDVDDAKPTKKYIINDWQDRLEIKKSYRRQDLRAPATPVGYHDLSTINIPNQFYYAVPEGLIKETEVPSYAGIIIIGSRVTKARKAPYLHKREMDLDKILLKKFYNLWRYKGRRIDQNERA
jgi:hypothetical protein